MRISSMVWFMLAFVVLIFSIAASPPARAQNDSLSVLHESRAQYDARMQWWNEARFGMFIHWGLYAIPAGTWEGRTDYGEWIRNLAHIPVDVYDKYVSKFNPTKFSAAEWVRIARNAGVKYIVITSKHHDGFCLFDSKYTDFDVMSTPFKRDILKELSDACHKQGIKICWYYSIMDWHRPDYLPRRDWEKDRSTEGTDFDRYVLYMKNQLRELVTHYGDIGVLWFDGEWEGTWNTKRGLDLYRYVRSLEPHIIINNRVGAGRSGMEGFTKEGEFAGDYATPEQEVPATGVPGVYWETCMTMNDHWGYNSHDNHWKSSTELIRTLADIASKGGNFLLNVGPTAEGLIPQPSVDRLRAIGTWMKKNGEAIYGTSASPFKNLPWGRCTQKPVRGGTRLYLHVFAYPADGVLRVPGLHNDAQRAYLLADPMKRGLKVRRDEDALCITLPHRVIDTVNTVVVLDVRGAPDVFDPPSITSEAPIFVDGADVAIASDRPGTEVKYTLDGSVPSPASELYSGDVHVTSTTTITARCFQHGGPVSGASMAKFTRVAPRPSVGIENSTAGVRYSYYEGDWDRLPDFDTLKSIHEGEAGGFTLSPARAKQYFGLRYNGFLKIPADGVYTLYVESDDGSRLYVGDTLVVENGDLHAMLERKGVVALASGMHPFALEYFQKSGDEGLKVSIAGPGLPKQEIPEGMLFRAAR